MYPAKTTLRNNLNNDSSWFVLVETLSEPFPQFAQVLFGRCSLLSSLQPVRLYPLTHIYKSRNPISFPISRTGRYRCRGKCEIYILSSEYAWMLMSLRLRVEPFWWGPFSSRVLRSAIYVTIDLRSRTLIETCTYST